MNTIGKRIKARREELSMSQDELARKIGYSSRSSIGKIETDDRNLTQAKLKMIADALETSPEYIMGWEKKGEDELMSKIEKLDETDKKYITMTVDMLLEQEKYNIKRDSFAG